MKKRDNNSGQPRLEVSYVDTGGTFSDSFLVDVNGDFLMGKAPSDAADLAGAYFNSVAAATQKRGLSLKEVYSQLSVVGYGATVAINTLLTRTGAKIGLMVTKGFEHLLLIGRGRQSWEGYDLTDRIHYRSHRNTPPLVPYSLIKGVTERIGSRGDVIIPLYEHEAQEAAEELIEIGVEAIVVCFLTSWQNPAHEERCRAIVNEVSDQLGKHVPVYLSAEISPVIRELSHLNGALIEAYVTPRAKSSLEGVSARLKDYGYKGSLQVMQSTGGLAPAETVKMIDTLQSGPVGGVIGGLYIGQLYGFDNIVTTDVGGTSFDVGLVTRGIITLEREPVVARMVLGVPAIEILSIGAGGGTLAKLDPLTGRIQVGPDSAGAVPGPACYDQGGKIPTVTDADLLLGYIDPDYFLGGKIKLNKEKAVQAIRASIADPLSIEVHEAAWGIKELLDTSMREAIVGMVTSRGYAISDYYLLGAGGAGATHIAGYTEGLPLKGLLVPPFAAVFCAFGAAAADYERNYTQAKNIIVPPFPDDETKVRIGAEINELWQSLEQKAYDDMRASGFNKKQIQFTHLAMIRYGRQLDDLIVPSPAPRITTAQGWDKLIAAFEQRYEKIYALGAKYPRAGYEILQVGLKATVPKVKPKLKRYPLGGAEAPKEAVRCERECYFRDGKAITTIYNWPELGAGNSIRGPAILESPTTNLVLPPGMTASIDEFHMVWLKR